MRSFAASDIQSGKEQRAGLDALHVVPKGERITGFARHIRKILDGTKRLKVHRRGACRAFATRADRDPTRIGPALEPGLCLRHPDGRTRSSFVRQ